MAQIFLTAQNIDIYDGGLLDPFARTGSTSIEQVANAGAQGVILGHSEVNDLPGVVKMKLQTIIERRKELPASFLNKNTILVGESWEEFHDHSPEEIARIVSNQLSEILQAITADDIINFTVGYEPKWGSRGSGHDDSPPPEPSLVFKVTQEIVATLSRMYGEETSSRVPIIYGGRSTP